jgi:uncharacterized lipoprotein YddW (UPF0748 family)
MIYNSIARQNQETTTFQIRNITSCLYLSNSLQSDVLLKKELIGHPFKKTISFSGGVVR